MSFVIHFIMWMELVKGEQKGKSNKQNWNFSRRREVVVFFVCSSKEFHYCFVINEQHDDKRFGREHFLLIRRPSWSLKSFFFLFCHPISLFLFSTSLNQVCIRSVSAKLSSEPFFFQFPLPWVTMPTFFSLNWQTTVGLKPPISCTAWTRCVEIFLLCRREDQSFSF